MYSKESRLFGHCDTDLDTLPEKMVLLSAAKQLTRLYDNSDEMFVISELKCHSQSTQIKTEQQRCWGNKREQ